MTERTRTKPEVFIIETLSLKDEEKQRKEGRILCRMLRLVGKRETKYYYIRTRLELKKIIKKFRKSGYRYLHLSCHASEDGIDTTFEKISNEELMKILRPHVKGRRVFVSACKMANLGLASRMPSGCLSLVGPKGDIGFDDAAIFWASFYHLMFNSNDKKMNDKVLDKCIKKLDRLFKVKTACFFREEFSCD